MCAADQFSMRLRVRDKLLDEYALQRRYPGTLETSSEISELYEWMTGPLTSHFLCPTPPSIDTGNDTKPMCYLPDGQFISDNVIELRQVRVKPIIDESLDYFGFLRYISIGGGGVTHGGGFSDDRNRNNGPTWVLPPPAGFDQPLNMSFESNLYRATHRFSGVELRSFSRWGWYDVYEMGGFAVRSSPQGSASDFIRLVEQLQQSDWIDRLTRAITVNTMLFNPARGLGCLVTVLIETPTMGVIRITPDVLVMQHAHRH
jgi:hypothetical protein